MSVHSAMNSNRRYTITFKNKDHDVFYMNCLTKCRQQDVYHKALIYCLGISDDTRQNVERIYDFNKDSVKIECLGESWITSSSARIVRMAFNLFCNGTPSAYDLEEEEKVRECQRYTVEDLFCCEYAVYFLEAIKEISIQRSGRKGSGGCMRGKNPKERERYVIRLGDGTLVEVN